MKAIYINLDPYLRAIVDGTPIPAQPSVPLAVTIPAGASVALIAQTGSADGGESGSPVCGISWTFAPSLGEAVKTDLAPGMSAVLSGETASAYAVSGDAVTATATIGATSVSFPVLVRRARASGPIDLIDLDAGGGGSVELTADAINRALGGTGASGEAVLAGVSVVGADFSGAVIEPAAIGQPGNNIRAYIRTGYADGFIFDANGVNNIITINSGVDSNTEVLQKA